MRECKGCANRNVNYSGTFEVWECLDEKATKVYGEYRKKIGKSPDGICHSTQKCIYCTNDIKKKPERDKQIKYYETHEWWET